MKKAVLPLLFLLLNSVAWAQLNCTSFNQPVPPGDECFTAPPFCETYLNGYCSNNGGFTADTMGNLLSVVNCTIENNQWLTFVACETDVEFSFQVGNCNGAGGLEFSVFKAFGCQVFSPLAACLTVLDGQSSSLMLNGLVPGDTYYLMVDGINGDVCDWKITGLVGVSGEEVLQEDITPGHIDGPTKICLEVPSLQSQPVSYKATAPDCKIVPADTSSNTCLPAPDFCPPAPQKFSDPYLDTIYNPIAWDTVWHILPPAAGFFVNSDSIGETVNVVWDSVGHFKIDADLVVTAWDTVVYTNDGIANCTIICPDNDPCDIPPLDVDVGAPDVTFETYVVCQGDCAFAHNQIFCNPGQYLITELDSTGCTDSIFIDVLLVPNVTANIIGPTLVCFGEPTTLTASVSGNPNQYTYFWSTGQTTQSIVVVSPGNYAVTVNNSFGCFDFDSHQLTWLPPITMVLAPLTLCQEDLPYDFNGTSVTSSGNYSVVLTSWQGCDSTVNQAFNVVPPVVVSIVSSVGTDLPLGGSATLDAGAGFASYLWQTGENTQTITVDQPGTYTVTVTNGAGCTGTASITLVQVAQACTNFNLPVAPSDSCSTAPPFCASYLNEYCSSNAGFTADIPGNLGSAVPCTIENNQWLSFVTCSDSAQLVLNVNNCAGATGLEFFVLQTTDCQIFTAKTACFEIADGATDTLLLANLQPNETYYLMVDGIGGDVCNWQVLSTQGISDGATYQEDNTPGQVTGPSAVCSGGTFTYTFTSPICDLIPLGGCPANQQFCLPQLDTCVTVQYDTIWHVTPAGTIYVNNDSMGLTVEITFPDTLPIQPGGSMDFVVSVEFVPITVDTFTCINNCISQCGTILPDTEPCAILPLTVKVCKPNPTDDFGTICSGECYDFYGETFCQPGIYTVNTTDQCNCISTHTLTLDVIFENPPTIANLLEICNPAGTEYTVSFDVISFGGFITVNGQPLNGLNFTSAPIPSGQPYSFMVNYLGQCNFYQVEVSGQVACLPCTGETFDIGTIALCPGTCFDLQGNSYCAPGNYSELFTNTQTNCIDTYNFTLTQTVENQLVVDAATEFCDASNLYYSVGFSIMDGTPPFAVNGIQIPGNTYQSGLIPSGQSYAFSVTDAATCSPQEVTLNGVYNCACLNSPGSVNLNATLYQCEGGMVTAEYNNDAALAPGDIHVFILHSNSGNTLGTIVGTNTTGTFSFVPGLMNFGQTYFISPAVGPDLGGMVDMASSCFSFAPGQAVIFYPTPEVQILPTDTISCLVNTLTISSLASGGSGDFSYNWAGPLNFGSTDANPSVSNGGAYLLTLTDNLTGCQAQSATAVASDIAPPVFTVTNSEINCQQPNAILEAASQMPGVTYTWTFPTGDVMTGASISTNIPGAYAVTAVGTNGCSADAATFVTDNGTPPSLQVTGDTINCSQPTVELVASSTEPSATFTWLLPDSSTFVGSLLQTGLAGNYSVVAASQNGCTTEAQTQVVQGPDPLLDTSVEVHDPSCHGYMDGSIKVLGTTGGTAPYTYTLNDTLSGDFFQNLGAGIYSLETTDANGCTGEVQVQLVDPQEVTVSIGDDQFINPGEAVTLTVQSGIVPDEIVWSGPDGRTWENVSELTINPTESGRYTIIISDVNMCRSSDTTYIYVNGQGEAYLPNVFSPNDDGHNDVFTIYAGGDVEQVLEMKIFDRWGGMKFVYYNFPPNDPAYGWDGKFKGKELDSAVFVVRALVRFKDGTEKLFLGDLMLIR